VVKDKLTALYDLGQQLLFLRDARRIAEAVLDIAARVLDLHDSDFLLVDEARRRLYLAARRGLIQDGESLCLSLDGGRGITVAAARSRQPVYVPDVGQDDRYVYTGFSAASELAIPVQIEDRVLGVLNVESAELDAFDLADRELLSILASQAALALENARLYEEQTRRIEETLILNEVARRINASLDLQATLDAIVAAAAELIPCALAEVSLWDEETEMLTLQALQCEPACTFPVGHSFPPGEGYTGWLVRHRHPLLVPDVEARDDIRPDLLPGELPFEAYAGVPLMAGETLVGTLVLVANEKGAFDADDMCLLQALAHHATTAIGNARLYEQLRRRHRELSALYSVSEAAHHPLGLEDLLQDALDRVVEVTGAGGGAIRLLDPSTRQLVLAAHRGLSAVYARQAERFPLAEEIVGWVARTAQPTLSDDMWTDARVSPPVRQLLQEVGHRSLAQVPLCTEDQVVGTLGIVARPPGFFGEDDLKLLIAIGQQVAIAIANARLRQEALTAERLAAVGRVATSVAHDLRSPLGGILRSAEFLARPEISPATRQKLGRAVVSLARRLLDATQEILDYVRGERLPLKRILCSLPVFLDDVLTVMEVDFSDRGIEVVRDCRYGGQIVMDADRMAQVVYNLAANARDAMPHGGTFAVETCQVGDRVELRFADTGPGVPPDLQERIFDPFFSHGKRQGAGLGLSIARRIVEEHGGELRLESSTERGATFVVSLPC
jgi:GAF domain-containing protein